MFMFSYSVLLSSGGFKERGFREDSEFVVCFVDALEFPGNNTILKLRIPYVM